MTLFGTAVTVKSGQTWAQAISAFETLTGRPLPVRRCYDGAPVTDLSSSAAKHDYDFTANVSLRKSLLSIKPTMTTPISTLESFANSLVTRNHQCDIIIYHEPVDNMTGPDFIALYQRSAQPFRDRGIPVGVCYTNWSANLPFSNSQSALKYYWPGDSIVDFVGFDEYPAPYTSDYSDMSVRARRITQFATSRGKPLSLCEYAICSDSDPAKGEIWMRSIQEWSSHNLVRDICYFHSDVGGTSGRTFWLDNKPEYVQAYKDLATLV